MLQKARMATPTSAGPGYVAKASTDAAREAVAPTPPEPEAKRKLAVKVQVTEVKGALTAGAVNAALDTELARLTACCQEGMNRGVILPKEILLKFTIGADGKVTSKRVIFMPVKYPKLWQCLTEIIRGIAFPAPGKEPVEVTAKLLLETGSGSK